ncbi:MAG: hypothetical protein FJY85_09025 [Deltaproteobacteria bacterium]|nr:hypothetical protein [Deltaproteobacteria bacterium]
MAETLMHCPGFEAHKSLTSVEFNCPECGKLLEVFSDEFDKPVKCSGCKTPVDFSKVKLGS